MLNDVVVLGILFVFLSCLIKFLFDFYDDNVNGFSVCLNYMVVF